MRPKLGAELLAEGLAGVAGAAAALPLVLTLGVLGFASTGAWAAPLGVAAALVSSVVGGLIVAVAGRTPMPTAGPSSAGTVIFAGLVAQLLASAGPALQGEGPNGTVLLVALAGLAVAAAGVLLLLMAALRLGSLARFVPQPVLAGFMNGVALLILAAQAAPLLGLSGGAFRREGLAALAQAQVLPLAIGALTALTAWLLGRRVPRAPSALVALAVGVAAASLASALGTPPLPHLQPLPAAWPAAPALALPLGSLWAALQQHAGTLALNALLLALLGGLESVLNIAATEQPFGFRAQPNRELAALGAANVASGLLGGLPVVYQRLRAVATWRAGGRSRHAAAAGAVAVGAALVLGGPWLGHLPLAVMAGLMVVTAFLPIDGWTHELARQWWRGRRQGELHQSLAIVAAVCGTTLWLGFAAGVALGVLLSMAVLLRAMNRSLVRTRFDARTLPSRRVWPPALEALLLPLRARIAVVELEGALFFGNVARLAEAAAGAEAREVLIIDLRRVSTLDASGAVGLARLAQEEAQRGSRLWLAGVAAGRRHDQPLRDYGVLGAGQPCLAFDDTDRALEAAEQHLLAAAGQRIEGLAVPLAQCALFQGLSAAQLQLLQPLLHERRLAAGERLFGEGDAGSSLFVLGGGSISVVGSADAESRSRQRFVSFSPGMTLGETAWLDGGGRTADAVADSPSLLVEVDGAALQALQHTQPQVAAQLYRNLALHLSQRLRGAAAAWRRAAG